MLRRCLMFAGLVVPLVGAGPVQTKQAQIDTSVTLLGAGSTFVSNFLEQCKADLKHSIGANITYQPVGSGAGRSNLLAGSVDFAASDMPFTAAELAKTHRNTFFVHVPIVAGGVAVAYRVPEAKTLTLSSTTLAKIFTGAIVSWDDKAIAGDNPGLQLPRKLLKVVVRSDSSGTSNVFSSYLAAVAPSVWKTGPRNTFPIPPGVGVGQKGSDGVANYVDGPQGNYSITYAELSFARERRLRVAAVINASGTPVAPTAAAVSAALEESQPNTDGSVTLDFTPKNAAAYPISTVAYLIAPTRMGKAKSPVFRALAGYGLGDCQKKAEALGYARLPANLVTAGMKALARIKP